MYGERCYRGRCQSLRNSNCGRIQQGHSFFFSSNEAAAFADYAETQEFKAKDLSEKELHKIAKKTLNPALDGLDIALFGRMVAQASELNVEAAASFSHALSTHKVSNEVEFFTALDDLAEEPGSAHMGSLEFNSATYYRYISLDLGQLYESLEGEGIETAIEAFTKALFVAVPSARQNNPVGRFTVGVCQNLHPKRPATSGAV